MLALPSFLLELVDSLSAMPGAVGVVLGGSRAEGTANDASDWDLGVYYAGALDTTRLARFGTVHAPGSWGRLMNGGAWLSIEGHKVDVLLRDVAAVERWSSSAGLGRWVDGLADTLGHR